MQPYELYGQICSYYTAKARAYLQYKALPYRDHGATAALYRDVIVPRTGLSFVPVVITPDGAALQDSCDIIETLEARHPERPAVPSDPALRFAAALFEYVGDECLIYPGLHMRWHYDDTRAWILGEFARVSSGGASDGARDGDGNGGASRFAVTVQRYADRIGMDTPEARQAARAVFDELMAAFEEHLKHAPYLLGASPSLADIAFMGPIFGHFYRDLESSALMRRDAPRVCTWVERMNTSNAAPSVAQWELLPSAAELLRCMASHFGALVQDSARSLDAHVERLPAGTQLSRHFDTTLQTRLGQTPITKTLLNSYWTYKQQRVRDVYHGVDAAQRAPLDRLLSECGCEALLTPRPAWRVAKNAAGWLQVGEQG
jgi:glutathione S-transferase